MEDRDKKVIFVVLSLFCIVSFSISAGFLGGAASFFALQRPEFQKFLPDSVSESVKEITKQTVVEEESATIDIVEETSPAVVSIVAKTVGFDIFKGPTSEEQSIGTGFIIDKSGIILTNRHVVDGANVSYSVVTKEKEMYEVENIELDLTHDLAILKVDAKDLPTVELGNSDSLKVGQKVIAIGNALGQFDNTVTTGVVSGLGRLVTASSGGSFGSSEVLENIIQTDAALNPGNSGGPLLDYGGNVVGINVAVTRGAENIGFAIPIDLVKPVVENFQQNGRIVRPFLGVEYVMISSELSKLRDIPEGAYIQSVVRNTPASEAGLKAGDILVKMDGEQLSSSNTLAKVIGSKEVGDEVTLSIVRGEEEKSLKATLEEAEE